MLEHHHYAIGPNLAGRESQDDESELDDPLEAWDSAFATPSQPKMTTDDDDEEEDDDDEGDLCSSHSSDLEDDDDGAMEVELRRSVPYEDADTVQRAAVCALRLRALEARRARFEESCVRVKAKLDARPINVRSYKRQLRSHDECAGVLLEVQSTMGAEKEAALEQLRRAMFDDRTHITVPDEVRLASEQGARQIKDAAVLRALAAHLDGHQLWALQQSDAVQFWTLATPQHYVMVAEPTNPDSPNAYLFYVMIARDALKL